jgi:hypothetical protein
MQQPCTHVWAVQHDVYLLSLIQSSVTCCREAAHEQEAPQQAELLLQQQQHLSQVLAAWQSHTLQQQQWHTQQLGRAVRWQRRRVQLAALSSWHCMCMTKLDQRQQARKLWHSSLLSRAFKVGGRSSRRTRYVGVTRS